MEAQDQRRERVLALDETELDVLAVLAATGEGLVRSKLAKLASSTGIRLARRAINANQLKPLLKKWEASGLIVCETRGQYRHFCRKDVAHWVLDDAVRRGRISTIARVVDSGQPGSRGFYYAFDPLQLLREARLALYRGQRAEALKKVAQADERRHSFLGVEESFSWAALWGWEAPKEALELLPPLLAERYVRELLSMVLQQLHPIATAPWACCLSVAAANEELASQAMMVAVLRGDGAACRDLVANANPVLRETGGALAALVEGEAEGARTLAARALEQSRGPKRTRKPRIDGLAEPFLALLLLTGDSKERVPAQDMLSLRRKREPWIRVPLEALEAIDSYLKNPNDVRSLRNRWWSYANDSGGWARALFWGLYAAFTEQGDDDVAADFAEHSQQARLRADRNGYRWLSLQFEILTEVLASAEHRTDGLVALYAVRTPWERALDALSAVARSEKPKKSAAEQREGQRIRWIVTVMADVVAPARDNNEWIRYYERYGYCDERGIRLEPKLQRRRARGWTAGSAISLPRLQKMASEGKLPPEDARVCASIRKGFEWSTRHEFDERVGVMLVGHPRVQWEDGGAVDVVCREPTLAVDEREGTLHLTLRPTAVSEDQSIAYERDGAQLVVYPLESVHRKLVSVVGDGITVPAANRAQLERTLGDLAGLVPLESHVAVRGGDAETVEADPRPVIQLRRGEPGLKVMAQVFPLGLSGPGFAPGQGRTNVVASLQGRALRAQRSLARERELWTQLCQACGSLPSDSCEGAEVALPELLNCYELLTELSRVDAADVVVAWPEGQALSVVAEREVRDMKLRLKRTGDWLTVDGELEVDPQHVLDLASLLARAAEAQGRFIELGDGRLLALSNQLRRRLDALRALGRKKRKTLELAPMALFALESWIDDGTVKLDRGVEAQLERMREAQSLDCALPKTIRAELRDYQRDGFRWLCRLAHWGGGACLADDMGLGKTLQVLTLLVQRAEQGPALVVAPTSVCGGWIEQAARFCPTLKAVRYGAADRGQALASLGHYDVLVVSYGLLAQDIDAISAVQFATAVLDEAQAIKNASTLRARAAQRITAACRVVTTGTPVENHLGEIWSQMHFLNPGLLGSARQFEQRFGRPIQRDGDRRAAEQLRKLLRPFVLRRTKAQVLEELPPKTEVVLRVPLGEEQRALYEAVRQKALQQIGDDSQPAAKNRMRLLGELMRLRRAACHPRLVIKDSDLGSTKLEMLFTLLGELREGGHRALVFSQFVDHLRLVREGLDANGVTYQYLDGSTPPKKREQAVAAFQRGEGELFLISLRAGGFGLNLTAADYVIHLDPWWNPAVEDQASDRVHRIGQQRPVTIYKLVSEGTIEEKILALHGEKRELAARLLAGSEKSTTLSIDQLRELLQGA